MNEPCPECGSPFLVVGGGAKNPKLVCPKGKECGYSRPIEEAEMAAVGGALPAEGADGDGAANGDGAKTDENPGGGGKRSRSRSASATP